jgi:peptidoglycan/xylan/chitin deacetylase (PgdA/CDA1 family)
VPELERGGLIEIGAHTVNHPDLPSQTPDAQREEIVESKRALERQLGHAVNGFAYPYGRNAPATIDLVRDAGFTYACSTVPQPVRRHSNPYLLPRQTVMNWNGDEFDGRLRRWLTR